MFFSILSNFKRNLTNILCYHKKYKMEKQTMVTLIQKVCLILDHHFIYQLFTIGWKKYYYLFYFILFKYTYHLDHLKFCHQDHLKFL
jgi:hypothetical protein